MTARCRRTRRSLQPLALVVGLDALGACAPDDPPLPPVVWEGDNIRARMDDPGIQVCGGSFESLDRHAQLVRDALMLEGDALIEYSMGDADFVQSVCSGPGNSMPAGCTYWDTGRIYTGVSFVPHEIVHSVRSMDPQLGYLSSAFEEGLATLFGADWVGKPLIPLEAQGILDDNDVRGLASYDRAGQTMAILIARHGMEAFRRFDVLARTRSEASAFSEVFGESKEEFAAFAETEPHCEQSQWWVPLLECDGEPITADPDTGLLTFTGNLSCAEADVQGSDFGRMYTSRHFRLDGRTSFFSSYEVDMPEEAKLEIIGCHGGCPERVAYIGGRLDLGAIYGGLPDLQPGEYFLRLSRPISEDDGHFEIVIDPLPL